MFVISRFGFRFWDVIRRWQLNCHPTKKAGSFHHDPADILRTSMDDMETQPMDLPAFDLSSMSLTLIVHRLISDVSDVFFFP